MLEKIVAFRKTKTPTMTDSAPPRKSAIALSYVIGDELPKIVATGRGKLADEILQIAFERGIRVRRDPDLANLLVNFDIDAEIPLEAIEAVAEILAYVYRENGKMAALKQHLHDQPVAGAPPQQTTSVTLASRAYHFNRPPNDQD
jgi:flagellar biosynthesis protein